MLNPKIINQYKNKKVDAASTMTDISGKNILMGFWHNWRSEPGQGYQQGMFAEMPLTAIHEAYNIIAVAFMKGSGIPTFKPYNMSDEEFRAQVAELNTQGRAVLISLGGADAHIELHAGQEEALAYEIIRLVEVYGFDGLDIDLEQAAITFADNRTVLPAALRMVREHYNTEGKHFIISMAPEFPYLRASKKLPVLKEITTYFPFLKDFVKLLESLTSGGAYLAYINALEDIYDFIAPQYYNQGGDGIWVDELDLWVTQNNDAHKKEFLYYLTDSLIHGTRGFTKIPANRLAIGLPTNNDAAATGYVINPDDVKYALDKLQDDGNPIRGLMTWSVNWDNGISKGSDGDNRDDGVSKGRAYDWEFAKRYGYLTGGETPVPDKPSVPTGLRSTEQTPDSVKLVWSLSVGQNPVLRYELRRDNSVSLFADSPSHEDTGLQPGTTYSYQVRAIDVMGNTSAFSAAISVSTQAGSGGGAKPTTPVLSLAGVTDKSVSLKWTLSSSDIGIDKYPIGRDGWPIAAVLADQPPEYTDNGLTAGKKYTYYVVAKDTQSQWSEVSNLLEVSTDPAPEKPSVPVDFRSTGRTTTSITLDWSVSTDASGPFHYELFREGVSIGKGKVPPFTDEGLLQSRLYGYHIIATDSLGNSSGLSEELLATTGSEASNDRPAPPGNLRQAGATTTSVSLAWDAPTGGTAVDVYHIYSFDAPTVTVDSTVLTYTVRGLTPGKTYQYLVGARDKDLELSGPSNVVQASTSAALPEWKTDTDYVKGDKVMHAGASYICLNPHHSQVDWYPGSAPTLWAPWTEQAGGRGFRDWPKEWQ
ncbi:chitinase [Pseudomonas syringae KCTC 12500]|uniref:fibronectin type III domain-containing protein n=1 Tax=Pseudomonas syringae TaxID=317 RepID=UPI0003FF9086|nr:fibronectin type III domain-containing protein [Pseudomonas syringae]KMY01300.1 chitinase [Pseudomonas syringae KCTC 12500]KPY67681.1 Chitinase family 18 [Pseudomonas syringae pv. syringae]POR83043.1 chitinase [Pseudomonas syringae pv. syringae]